MYLLAFASDPNAHDKELFLGLVDLANPTHWVMVSLLLFIALLLWKKVPSLIAKSLDQRAKEIQDELIQARNLREEAQELLASYTRKQRAAEKEAEEIVAHAKHEARLYADEMREQLSEQLERRSEAATRRIEQAEAQAAALVREKAVDMAIKAAETGLQGSITKAAGAKLVDQSIKEIGSRL